MAIQHEDEAIPGDADNYEMSNGNKKDDGWVDVPTAGAGGGQDGDWTDVDPRQRGYLAGVKSSVGIENDQIPQESLMDRVGSAVLGPAYGVGKGLYQGARMAVRPTSELPESVRSPLKQAMYRGASLFAPTVGVNPESMEERGRAGDEAGIYGEATIPTATAAYAGVREPLSIAMREGETGALRPGVRSFAKTGGTVGGYLAGAGTGHPYLSALVGREVAPKLIDLMTPNRRLATPPASLADEIAQAGKGGGGSASAPGAKGPTDEGVMRLPEGRPRPYKLTPEQVPGTPELRSLAEGGESRAGTELQRRGKTVLYEPKGAGEYPPPRETTTFSSKEGGTRPTLREEMNPPSGTVGGGEGEPLSEMIRRRPTGQVYGPAEGEFVGGSKAAPTTESSKLAEKAEGMRQARKVGRPRSEPRLAEAVSAEGNRGPGRPPNLWQVGIEGGSLAEAKAAAKELGVNPDLVEEVDDGVYNMPLPKNLSQRMNRSGSFEHTLKSGKKLSGEMP